MTTSYPLKWPEGWPRTRARRNATFRTTFASALTHLRSELRKLGATHVVISSWLPLRVDGLPRADAARSRLPDPGVAIYFRLRDRPMVMARDSYISVHDNLRSIGLAVAHLRGLERHGGAVMMERAFQGFQALPAPSDETHWTELLGRPENWSMLSPETQRAWVNSAFARVYQDALATGIPTEQLIALRAARDQALANVGQTI